MSQRENEQRVKLNGEDIERIGQVAGSSAGKAAGAAAGKQVSNEIKDLKNQISTLNNKVASLEDEVGEVSKNIEDLNERVVEIEETKARAEREAKEDIRNSLKERFEEKQQEFEEKRNEVLEQYQQGLERIKDRFLSSISGQKEKLDQVGEEFEDVTAKREGLTETEAQSAAMGANYRERRSVVEQSRGEFSTAVDEFFEDREETKRAVDSLKTPIRGIDDAVQVHVPFWVVGIERDGREEIRVLPIAERGRPDHNPAPQQPYVPYLQPHRVHGYSDFVADVESWVQRDHVRDRLASDEGPFADPSFLGRLEGVGDRFIDALFRFELYNRETAGGSTGRSQDQQGQQRQRQPTTEVATDD